MSDIIYIKTNKNLTHYAATFLDISRIDGKKVYKIEMKFMPHPECNLPKELGVTRIYLVQDLETEIPTNRR